MFENLTKKLQEIFDRLKGKGKLSAEEVDQALKEVRVALLSADVHVDVVKHFSERLRGKAISHEILDSLTPVQQVIKLVRDELSEFLGPDPGELRLKSYPASLMLVGLQGSGKTTTCVKLARQFKKQGKGVLLVGLDVKRPAALEQLRLLAMQEGIPCFIEGNGDPLTLARKAKEHFRLHLYDLAILDTAGRLHLDQELMEELRQIEQVFQPSETMLVLDATTGHVALAVSEEFRRWISIDSLILTKMDGDARGGAALSAKFVAGKPIRLLGTGEKIGDLELFHADRLASRVLGMGDLLTLIEKAERAFQVKEQSEIERKLLKEKISLIDFLEQLKGFSRIENIEELLPTDSFPRGLTLEGSLLPRLEAVILSMTVQERLYPEIINSPRKKRIAQGSGTSVQEVNQLLRRFEQYREVLKRVRKGAFSKKNQLGGIPWP